MCPQSPSQLVVQYRKEQRLLLNNNLFESSDIVQKINDILGNADTGTPTEQEEEKCNDFLKKLKECKLKVLLVNFTIAFQIPQY